MSALACRLTDEELAALTDGAPTPVASPYLELLDPATRAVACQTAQRSLMVRRLLEPTGDLRSDLVAGNAADDQVPGQATGLAGLVLGLRAGAPVVAVLHRLLGAPRDSSDESSSQSRYLHVVADTIVVEDVTPAGVHSFGLTGWDRMSQVVREFLVPPDADRDVSRDIADRSFADPGDPARLMATLGHPPVLAESVVLHGRQQEAPPSCTLALGPGGCFVGTPGSTGTRFQQVGANGLVEGLVAQVAAAREAVQR